MLNLQADLETLLRDIVDIESVSSHEAVLADAVEEALSAPGQLSVWRSGNTVIARTDLGRPQRVVIAGHLDTVPVAGNLPSWVEGQGKERRVYGRGSCDMKGGVAVMLAVAVALPRPDRDITWIFYDNEEVEASRNGLGRVARENPDALAGDLAVLMEPTNARVEGGCQGTLRVDVVTTGVAAHSARSWRGHNAIHDAAEVLTRLRAYEPRQVHVDGLRYREGLNAVRVSGGVATNVVPDRCAVTVNYRFAPDRSGAAAEAHIRQLFEGFDITVLDLCEGARPGLDAPAAREFLAAVGREPQPKYGWTDVARFAALGMPALNYGPGDPGTAHADDEFCPTEHLTACRDTLLRWLAPAAAPR